MKISNKRVLIIATSRKTRGGITAVIKAHEKGFQWKKFNCKWLETHRDGNYLRKIFYLIVAYIKFIFLIPFYDIVHIHFSMSNSAKRKYFFFSIAQFFNKKIIIHLHCGNQLKDIWSPIYEKMFRQADVCIVLSNVIKEMIEVYIGKNDNLFVLYNPCPILDSPCLSKVKNQVILFAGTVIPDKGYVDLINSFSIIANKHPEWKLIFAGNGDIENGKLLVKELKIENQVNFLGWVSGAKKESVFQSASIFCLPSYAEGFPMAVLDAWAYGLPVITTPVGGIPDIVIHEQNGLLFNPGDVETLSKHLELLITDSDLRNNLSKESKRLSETTFKLENINKQIEDLYQRLFSK